MNILYDIAVLGVGRYNPLARTGVSRVVENLAYGLLDHPECQVSLCSTLSLPIVKYCLSYLESNPRLKAVPFIHPNFLTLFYNKWLEVNSSIGIHLKVGDQGGYEPSESREFIQALKQNLQATEDLLLEAPLLSPEDMRKADIFHATFYPIPKVIRQVKGIQRVLTIYDLIPVLFPHFFEGDYDKGFMNIINSLGPEDWVLSISQATKDDLCNFSKEIDPNRVFVTHLAADPTLFYPCTAPEVCKAVRQKYRIPEQPYLLGLSTMEPRKNFDRLVLAFIQLVQQEHIQDLSLVLVGNQGWRYSTIFRDIDADPELRDRIIFAGRVADEDLAALYSGALAFVYPSIYEGFGLPPLEAMQCGVPVVSSNASSLPEVMGEAGILVDPMDTDGLAHSLLRLYQQPGLRDQMAAQSLEQAKKFSWQKCTEQTVAAYKIALG